MNRVAAARSIDEIVSTRESLAHFVYPYLDAALDHPFVSHGIGFRGRAVGYAAALRVVALSTPSEVTQEYWVTHTDGASIDAVVANNPQKIARDTFVAGRDAFRITLGAHLALRKAGVPRDERADIMQNSVRSKNCGLYKRAAEPPHSASTKTHCKTVTYS